MMIINMPPMTDTTMIKVKSAVFETSPEVLVVGVVVVAVGVVDMVVGLVFVEGEVVTVVVVSRANSML